MRVVPLLPSRGLSRYFARDDGEIVSTHVWRERTGVPQEPRVLLGKHDKDGYGAFVLINDGGARVHVRRATLICEAFHGPRPAGMTVRHIDGSRDNDRPENIVWSTHRENIADKVRHRTSQIGRNGRNRKTKLHQSAVRALRDGRLSVEEAIRRFDVSREAVYAAKSGRSWKWLGRHRLPRVAASVIGGGRARRIA